MLFIDFRARVTLHLSGTASIEWGQPGTPGDDGRTGRRVRFDPERFVTGWLPAQEVAHRAYQRNPALTDCLVPSRGDLRDH